MRVALGPLPGRFEAGFGGEPLPALDDPGLVVAGAKRDEELDFEGLGGVERLAGERDEAEGSSLPEQIDE